MKYCDGRGPAANNDKMHGCGIQIINTIRLRDKNTIKLNNNNNNLINKLLIVLISGRIPNTKPYDH